MARRGNRMQTNPMGMGLALLRRVAGSDLLQRSGLRPTFERLVYHGSRTGFSAVAAGNRSFRAVRRLGAAGRPPAASPGDLFDLTPSEDQVMLRDAAARFADQRLRAAAGEANEACAAPADLLEEAAELGLGSLSVPAELDGAADEHSAVTGALIHEAMARGDLGLAVACLAPVGAANALLRWGSAEQQAAYLAPFSGAQPPVAAIAVLEPRPLFDPFVLATVASADGDDVRISGTKTLVPRAADAEFFLVAADGGARGPELYIVERGAAGVSVEPDPAMGVRGAGLGRLRLDRVTVPAEARLGGSAGCDYASFIALSRLAWAAMAAGTGQAVLDHVSGYVNERKAFGEPISHRQAVAFMVAEIAIELEGLRLATWRGAARAETGASFAREAALARRLVARHGMAIGSHGVQLLGGHGFVKDHPVERWYRDLRAAGIMEGGLCL